MGHEDTPSEALPSRRHQGGESAASLSDVIALVGEFRRSVDGNFRQLREENANANRDTQARLSGIESRLSEGASTISKHDMQLAAVIEECAEHHRRIEKLEREGGSGLVARVAALEAKDTQRAKDEGAAQAVAEAAAQSPVKKILANLVEGAARALGPVIVGFVTWLAFMYAHAQPVAAPAPTQAGAHP